MALETLYLVQAFKAGKGARLIADTPIRCKSSDAARRTAEMIHYNQGRSLRFATSGDAEFGEDEEEPTIIFKSGRLPYRSRRHEGAAKSRRLVAAVYKSDRACMGAPSGHDITHSLCPRFRVVYLAVGQSEARSRRAVQCRRLEEHARSLAVAQTVTPRPTRVVHCQAGSPTMARSCSTPIARSPESTGDGRCYHAGGRVAGR